MARTLEDYVGKYTVQFGGGALGIVQKDYWLCIGTGLFTDPPPDGTKVGVSLVDPQGKVRVLPKPDLPAAFCYLVDGSLNCSGFQPDADGKMVAFEIQISLYKKVLQNRGVFRTAYFVLTVGDPDNVAVWGADDNDPPP